MNKIILCCLVYLVSCCPDTKSFYSKPKLISRTKLSAITCSGNSCTLKLEDGRILFNYNPDFIGEDYCLYQYGFKLGNKEKLYESWQNCRIREQETEWEDGGVTP